MRLLRTMLGPAVCAGILALSSAASPAAPVTISFLTHWPPETVAKLEAGAAAYKKDHPDVTIEVRAVPFGDLLTTLRSQGGQAGGPTIAGIYVLWLPELVRDKLVAEAPAANADDIKANWPQAVIDAASVAGKVYGYPNEIDLYALNYNKRLFAEAGIAAPPKSWDEFLADAEKLSKRNGDTVTQQGFGLINSWAAGVVHPFGSLLASNGGALVVDGKPALDFEERDGDLRADREAGEVEILRADDGYRGRQHHRPVPRQFRLREDGHDHHGELVGGDAEGRHGRQVLRHRDGPHPGRPER